MTERFRVCRPDPFPGILPGIGGESSPCRGFGYAIPFHWEKGENGGNPGTGNPVSAIQDIILDFSPFVKVENHSSFFFWEKGFGPQPGGSSRLLLKNGLKRSQFFLLMGIAWEGLFYTGDFSFPQGESPAGRERARQKLPRQGSFSPCFFFFRCIEPGFFV